MSYRNSAFIYASSKWLRSHNQWNILGACRVSCPRSISAFHHHVVWPELSVVDQFRPSIDYILRSLLLLHGSLRWLSGIELSNNLRIDTVQEPLGEDAKQRPRQVE